MCYDITSSLRAQLKRAIHDGDPDRVGIIQEKINKITQIDYHHVSAYQHPKLLVYTNDAPFEPVEAFWGLIPSWAKSQTQAEEIWNKTVNARGETIFEKASFKESAQSKRCLIYVDGFYEYHHFEKGTYPFLIQAENNEPLCLGGLWNEWQDPDTSKVSLTFTIVTTRGNNLMSKIHNNPKMTEARMPVILKNDQTEEWLHSEHPDDLQKLLVPRNLGLKAHTVRKLRGKNALGNVPEIKEQHDYAELAMHIQFLGLP